MGGLGLRRATDLQYPAFLASRAEARPLAEKLAAPFPEAVRKAVWAEWDRSTQDALETWQATLSDSAKEVAEQLLTGGTDQARGKLAQCLGRARRPPAHAPPAGELPRHPCPGGQRGL